MHTSRLRPRTGLAALLAAVALTAACGEAPERETTADSGSEGGGASAETATSAEELGGMDALVEAAKEEGTLNVIALPPDWANYGEMISTFSEKYGITVDSAQPDASSQDEINAAEQLAGTDRAPDVFDLGSAVARANVDLFAPYQVETWDEIPDELKDPEGRHVSDYTGFMSIGYDAGSVPAPTSVEDLLGPEYKGKVALNGDPTQAGAAFNGVVMAAIGTGGSADDIPASTSSPSSRTPATSCRSTRRRPRSRPARRPSSSTGTTPTPGRPRPSPVSATGRSSCRRTRS